MFVTFLRHVWEMLGHVWNIVGVFVGMFGTVLVKFGIISGTFENIFRKSANKSGKLGKPRKTKKKQENYIFYKELLRFPRNY